MNIVQRAKDITLNPQGTWPQIEQESATISTLFVPYLLVLAAIPAIASFIGLCVIGIGGFGMNLRMPFFSGLMMMVTSYILSLVMVFVLGWLISVLAPTFGGQSNQINGLKLAVYAGTPAMLAGVLNIFPMLGIVGALVSLYALYVLYLGLPVLMKNPKERSIPYMVVLVLAAIVGAVALSYISRAFMPSMSSLHGGESSINTPVGDIKISPSASTNGSAGQAAGSSDAVVSIKTPQGNASITATPGAAGTADAGSMTIKTPDGEMKIDMKKMQELAKQMEAAGAQMEKQSKQ